VHERTDDCKEIVWMSESFGWDTRYKHKKMKENAGLGQVNDCRRRHERNIREGTESFVRAER
jgi:hypothetical protein